MNQVVALISRKLEGDKVIWAIVILLSLFSLLVVYSATNGLAYRTAGGDTEYYLRNHAMYILLSFGAIYVASKIDYVYYSRVSRIVLIASVLLLIFAYNYGTTYHEATRWVTIPYLNKTFQPSDLARLALIVNLASMLSKRQKTIKEFNRAIVPLLAWCGIVCALIGLSDWSSASLLFLTCMLLMFIGRVPTKYILALVAVGMLAGTIAFTQGQRSETVMSRIAAWQSGEGTFQGNQAKIAIVTGGLLGKGAGNSTQRRLLPNPYADFIYAIIIEEYGLIGGILVIILYMGLLYRGMVIVQNSKRAFGGLLVAGLTFSLVVQALIHMAVVVQILPVTGLPLPMMSMGGTSLLFTGFGIGILLSVSRTEGSDHMPSIFQQVRNNFKKAKPTVHETT